MTTGTQWISDFRWALTMMRARRFRRGLYFSQRQAFDATLRPRAGYDSVIDYPDALYHIRDSDFRRAALQLEKCPQLGTTVAPDDGAEIYGGPQEPNGIPIHGGAREARKRLMKLMSPPCNPDKRF